MNPIFGLFDMTAYIASDSKILLKVTNVDGMANDLDLGEGPVVFAMYEY